MCSRRNQRVIYGIEEVELEKIHNMKSYKLKPEIGGYRIKKKKSGSLFNNKKNLKQVRPIMKVKNKIISEFKFFISSFINWFKI